MRRLQRNKYSPDPNRSAWTPPHGVDHEPARPGARAPHEKPRRIPWVPILGTLLALSVIGNLMGDEEEVRASSPSTSVSTPSETPTPSPSAATPVTLRDNVNGEFKGSGPARLVLTENVVDSNRVLTLEAKPGNTVILRLVGEGDESLGSVALSDGTSQATAPVPAGTVGFHIIDATDRAPWTVRMSTTADMPVLVADQSIAAGYTVVQVPTEFADREILVSGTDGGSFTAQASSPSGWTRLAVRSPDDAGEGKVVRLPAGATALAMTAASDWSAAILAPAAPVAPPAPAATQEDVSPFAPQPAPPVPPAPAAPEPAPAPAAPEAYYKNCDAARAAGAAPILRGEPGYRAGLDRDNDGVACE